MATVAVAAGGVVAFSVRALLPTVQVTESGEKGGADITQQVGELLSQSLPIECRLTVADLNVNGYDKTQDQWLPRAFPWDPMGYGRGDQGQSGGQAGPGHSEASGVGYVRPANRFGWAGPRIQPPGLPRVPGARSPCRRAVGVRRGS